MLEVNGDGSLKENKRKDHKSFFENHMIINLKAQHIKDKL